MFSYVLTAGRDDLTRTSDDGEAEVVFRKPLSRGRGGWSWHGSIPTDGMPMRGTCEIIDRGSVVVLEKERETVTVQCRAHRRDESETVIERWARGLGMVWHRETREQAASSSWTELALERIEVDDTLHQE